MGQKFLSFWVSHSDAVLPLAKNIVAAAVILIIGIVLSRGAQRLMKKVASARMQDDWTATSLLQAIIRYGILIICTIMALNIFGVSTTSLIAVLGAAGIAVGLALKDTLGNIAAGIILLVTGIYHKGEFIEFSSFMGTVKEINLFTTILETPDGIYISAPNSCIWGTPLKNYTRNGKRRMELSIGIAYSDSVDTAFQVMQNIIGKESRFMNNPAPQVILHSIEDNSVKITIRAWAANQDYWDIYWDLSKTIKSEIEASGLHIPLPQRNVYIMNDPKTGVSSK
ncbi:MAG: mechanosensitive ion channel [Treponema sp.]|nr:mechanosensitive ion channel [Treponema sp.]